LHGGLLLQSLGRRSCGTLVCDSQLHLLLFY
jgi:hypothetical protein